MLSEVDVGVIARVRSGDTSLFDSIPAQLSDNDRRSLLAVHDAVATRGPYVYLEIGSYLGGSLQVHLRDPRCKRIFSIDSREPASRNISGAQSTYIGNSTKAMLDMIKAVVRPDQMAKLISIEGDSSNVNHDAITQKAALCFIDAEHANQPVRRDFRFCAKVSEPHAVLVFHDAHMVFQAISAIVEELTSSEVSFRAYSLPDSVFVIDLGSSVHESETVRELLSCNHIGYLFALNKMAHYRAFYYRPFVTLIRATTRPIRKIVAKMR